MPSSTPQNELYDDFFIEESSERAPLFAVGHRLSPTQRREVETTLVALHTQYAGKLFSYAYSMLRCREDAEDAVQTTFMNAFGSLATGRVPRQEASWLFRITRNVCLNRIRTSQRKPVSSLDGIDVPSMRTVEDTVNQHLHVTALRHALDRLPEHQRTAIVMRELQGASYTEIATALDTSLGAVESLIFRARRQLAATLRAAADGPSGVSFAPSAA